MSLLNQTEVLMVDTVEHAFISSTGDSTALLIRLARLVTCILILGTNVPMITFIKNQPSKTFLDWMILFDCCLCLGELIAILIRSFDSFCVYNVFFSFFKHLCNRLLTIGIAIYRFTLVLGSSYFWSTRQKRVFEKIIWNAILLISLYTTAWAVYYRDNYRHFLGNNEHNLSFFCLINLYMY